MANESTRVEEKSVNMRRICRPGNWPRATEEVAEPGKFADGVIEEKVGAVNPIEGYVGYGLYIGAEDSDFPYYVKAHNGAGGPNSTLFGVYEKDFQDIKESFEMNPLMLCSWKDE